MDISVNDIKTFIDTVFQLSGYDFSEYSVKSLGRRLEKILSDYNCSMDELNNKIKSNPLLIEPVVKSITVNTTEFFRDPTVWVELEEKVIPFFKKIDTIKIWHVGCSYGHEPYSMLMLLNEFQLLDKTEIIATDLNSDVLFTAKEGRFRYFLDAEYLKNFDLVLNRDPLKQPIQYSKYFIIEPSKDILQIRSEFIGKIKFYKHDIVRDPLPNFNSFDVIMCRNLLIYFNMELQNKVLFKFYKALKLNSFLILGYHESILGSLQSYFDKSSQIYKKNK